MTRNISILAAFSPQRLLRGSCYAALALACLTGANQARAAGTVAGTDIQNIASATYDTPAGPVTIQSNTVSIRIDELLDVTITSNDPGDIVTTSGSTGNVQTFRVTNNGNGSEAFRLTADVAIGGDDFDPALQQIVIDANNNGVYDAGVDVVYAAGSNDPVLAPDESVIVFVITSTPAGVADGNRASVGLTAAAVTGTGTPGTTFAGAGQGGGNAVVGTTGADGSASGFLAVQATTASILKSAIITDPFGGNRPVPGAIITYTLVASVSGTGTLANLAVTDPIPAGVQYQPGSMTLETGALTDTVDADAGNYDGTRIAVALGNVPAGQTRTIAFKVVIP